MDPASGDELCDRCHLKRGSCHILAIVNGEKSKRNLCPDCLAIESPSLAALTNGAPCEYCGGPASSGSIDTLGNLVGEQHLVYRCYPCTIEMSDFVQKAMKALPTDVTHETMTENFRRLRKTVNEHMREWVRLRRLGSN